MRFVPNWLHTQLLSFAWYQRKCGLFEVSPELSAITKEVLRQAHAGAWMNLPREYDHCFEPGAKITIRKPVQLTRRAVSGD